MAIGHVTLLKDIPEPKDVSPMAGLKVNKDGEVRDSDGEVLGKLTDGLVDKCVGKKIDNNGDGQSEHSGRSWDCKTDPRVQ